MGTATPERGKGEEVGIDLRGDWTWEEGRDLRHRPSPGLRTHMMHFVGALSLRGQFPHGVPSFFLLDSELDLAISGKTNVVAAVR